MPLPNPVHEKFAQDYSQHGSARKAAMTIGLPASAGSRLLTRPEVQKRVDQLMDDRYAKHTLTADRVLKEVARIAFHDLRDLYDDHGNLLPVHELSDDTAAVVSQIKVEVQGRGSGDDREMVIVKTIKGADKLGALNLLARHFKIVGDVDEGVNAFANALADRLNQAKRRENANQDAQDARIVDRPAGGGVSLTYGVPDEPSNARDVTNLRLRAGTRDPESLHFELPGPEEVPAPRAAPVADIRPAQSAGPGFQIQPAPVPAPAPAPAPAPIPAPTGDDDEIW